MVQVFVSYSSKSKALVSALAQDLETMDHKVWFDHKLTGGQAWWDEILTQIRACDLFVFGLTPEALDSNACRLEYQYAYGLHKHIMPILLSEGVSVNLLPPELTVIQFVDYRSQDKQSAFRLMNALNQLPPVNPLPDPLPAPPEVPISYLGSLKDVIDSPKQLSFEDQTSLVFKLKEQLRDESTRTDTVTLMKQLRRRNDLFAKIGEEIDALLVSQTPTAPISGQRSVQSPEWATTNAISNPPQQGMAFVQPKATGSGQAWSMGVMAALAIGTFFIPLIGLIAGVIALRSPVTRNQGIGLLAFSVFMVFLGLTVVA